MPAASSPTTAGSPTRLASSAPIRAHTRSADSWMRSKNTECPLMGLNASVIPGHLSMMRDRLLLAAAGAALLLTQYVATREIGSTFFSTELTALMGVLVTMIGPSVGYALATRLSPAFLAAWGFLSVAAHVALPVGLRALVGALSARGFDAWALAVTVLGGSFLLTGFYAVFLPRIAREPASLGKLYAAELGGALVALALIAASPSWRVTLA